MKITDSSEEKNLNLLVFRFSSMGDVALTLPILKGLLTNNKNLCITLVTRSLYSPFFENITGLKVYPCDFQGRYKGVVGIFRLFQDLRSSARIDHVIDLHSVIRTWILNLLFRFNGIPVSRVNKGRKEKKQLLNGKIFRKLKSTLDRYLDTFQGLDLSFDYPDIPVIHINEKYTKEAESFIGNTYPENIQRIGFAPFALHKLKTWPIHHTRELLKMIEEQTNACVYLFGGGPEETVVLSDLASDYNHCFNMAGEISLGAEIALMQKMHFMLTMDSSNMHLSSIAGVKTVTIWGATHPYAGFEAYLQDKERNFQVSKKDLPCRPCTVFGKGYCKRKDFACMEWLTPQQVFDKLINLDLLVPRS
jgi:ADP-heptose:LPS heptosyltransferase